MSPTAIISALAGFGAREDCEPAEGLCWLCAAPLTRGQRVDDWSGASFTGQNRVRSPLSTHVCEPCVWVCSRIAPVPGRPAKEGKKFGGNWRNYSHLWECGWDAPAFGDDGSRLPGYVNASKGEKALIRAFLARAHSGDWFAAIADSGQKHVLPWTPINPGGDGRRGVVLFEEQRVVVPEGQQLIDEMTALLTAGATKEELGSGDYTPRAWQLCGDDLRAFERRHDGERHGAWFALALWLAQRDEETVQWRIAAEKETKANARRKPKGKAAGSDSGGATRPASALPGDAAGQRAETLGAPVDAHASECTGQREPGGMVDAHDKAAPDRQPQQLSLEDLLRAGSARPRTQRGKRVARPDRA